MTRITNVDQILVLLQAQLERLERKKKPAPQTIRQASERTQQPLDRVRDLAAAGAITQSELGRALIAALLTEEFGSELAGDIAFQSLVERVSRALATDEHSSALMRSAIARIVSE